jgi:hypothetical protein
MVDRPVVLLYRVLETQQLLTETVISETLPP